MITRRTLLSSVALAPFAASFVRAAEERGASRFRYLLASAMYGQESLRSVLREAQTLGISNLDLWPKVHGAQREAIDEQGAEAVVQLVQQAGCSIDCLTRYDLGTGGIGPELEVARQVGASTIVTGPKGSKTPAAADLKAAVAAFVEEIKPTHDRAVKNGVVLAIENHRRNLFEAGDSLRYLADFAGDLPHLKIALAPAHLPQDADAIAALIQDVGPKLHVFYAWERGNEFLRKVPTGRELEQLPGRGSLDFRPLVAALDAVDFDGWTSIFMHPVPRGIPAAGSVQATTEAIAAARRHLESL